MHPPSQHVEAFLNQPALLLDVRSPKEFAHAHLPGALNLPLFNDEERHEVGCCYAEKGQEAALLLGLERVAPKLPSLIRQLQQLLEKHNQHSVKLYCWRGGMRSASIASLIRLANLPVTLLEGGYKAFRRYCLQILEQPYQFSVLGGFTGSGKTDLLKALKAKGEQTVDLEALAGHRGSAFGGAGLRAQATQEAFENGLASLLSSMDPTKVIWIEDESRFIGKCQIPASLFNSLTESPLFILETPKKLRINRLINEYQQYIDPKDLGSYLELIQKRLGKERTAQAYHYLETKQKQAFTTILLDYYDRCYQHSLEKRKSPTEIVPFSLSIDQQIDYIIKKSTT